MAVAGRVMLLPKGKYDPLLIYDILDVVTHNNKLWICRQVDTVGVEPSETNSAHWQLAVAVERITETEIDLLDSIDPEDETASTISNDDIDTIINS